jgi:tetratricopeptide (TPR) repeat protein
MLNMLAGLSNSCGYHPIAGDRPMARPAKLLGFALCSALLMPTMQLAGAATQNAGQLRGLGDRFLNGSGAGNQGSRQEPVTLGATKILGFFDTRDTTQIPGFLGASEPLPLVAIKETGDLDPLTGAGPQVEPLPLLAESPQILAQAIGQSDASRLYQQGLEQFRRGQFPEAIASWEQVLEIARTAGNGQGEGNVLNALGEAYRNLSQYERAIGFYEEALAIAREISDRAGEGHALGNLGIAYDSLGQPERAIDFYGQQLAITREIGDRVGEGRALGNIYVSLGQFERAIDLYEQVLALFREIGDRAGEGSALGNLGVAYSNLG